MIDLIAPYAPMAGLLFFFTFFVVMVVWVYRPGARRRYQNYARIPFAEGRENDGQ